MNELRPTKYFYQSTASSPLPCRWEGWVNYGATSLGIKWVRVDLMPATVQGESKVADAPGVSQ